MPDIVLVQPIGNKVCSLAPLPLGLLAISTIPYSEGYNIKIIDQRVETDWKQKLIDALRTEPLCVGVSVMIGTSTKNAIEISKIIKANSNAPVVWGGPIVSIKPLDCLQTNYVDILVQNEGEKTFAELVECLNKRGSLSKVKGIWYKTKEGIKHTENRPLIDLNSIPDSPYELLDMHNYKITSWNSSNFTMNIMTSRGCNNRCSYCYTNSLFNSTWRSLKPERVISLICKLSDKYKTKDFLFMDDNFFVSVKRSIDICRKIKEEKLDLRMEFQGATINRIAELNQEDMKLLKRAGCTSLNFGLESGSERIRRLMNKTFFTFEQLYAVNKKLKEYDMIPLYNLMAGWPTENTEDLMATMRLTVKLKTDNPTARFPCLFLYSPIPGTESYEIALKNGYVPPKTLENWGDIDWGQDIHIHKLNEIAKAHPWITKEYLELYKKLLMINIVTEDKKILEERSRPIKNSRVLRGIFEIYRLIALTRYNNSFYHFMPEVRIFEELEKRNLIFNYN